jgi:hypothetical protein
VTIRRARPVVRGLAADGAALALMLAVVVVLLSPALTRTDLLVYGPDVRQHFSWELYNRRALANGHLPLWNPYNFTGIPALADFQTALFYPPHVLLRPLPLPAFLAWSVALHMFIASAGVYVLCRQIRTSRWAASAAGVAFLLGGAVTPRLQAGHLTYLYGIAWTPLVLALAIRSVRRGRIRPDPALVVVVALQLLSSFVQAVMYSLAIVAAYYAYACAWPGDRGKPGRISLRPLGQLAVLLTVAVGLCAFQLLPTARLVPSTGRAGGMTLRDSTLYALTPGDLAGVLFPLKSLPPTTRFYEVPTIHGRHNVESAALLLPAMPYVGLLLAAVAPLALLRCRPRRMVVFFAALGAIAVGLSLGDRLPLWALHHWLLPGVRIPPRVLFVAALAIAVLGAQGLDGLTARIRKAGPRRISVVDLWVFAIVPLCVGAIAMELTGTAWHTAAVHGTPAWLIAVEAVGLLAACGLIAAARRRLGMALVVALVLIECYGFSRAMVGFRSPDNAGTVGGVLRARHADRVVSVCRGFLDENLLMDMRIPTTDGFNSYFSARHVQFVELAGAESARRPGGSLAVFTQDYMPSRFDLLGVFGVTHLVTCRPFEDDRLELVWTGGRGRVYEYRGGALPRVFWTCRAAEVAGAAGAVALLGRVFPARGETRRDDVVDVRWVTAPVADGAADFVVTGREDCGTPARIEVRDAEPTTGRLRFDVTAPREGFVFIGEHVYPERRAWVDGRETTVHAANLVGSLVAVPAGRHEVELRYVPTSFYLGCLVSGLTLAAWLADSLARRRGGQPEESRRR